MDLVDIHCHMLWGLDDGCRTQEETVEAARALASLGYTDVAPSPHAQARYAGGDEATSARRLAQARLALSEAGIGLRLHAGAENPLDRRYLVAATGGKWRGLGESQRYALVELPFIDAVPDMVPMLQALRAAGRNREIGLEHVEAVTALLNGAQGGVDVPGTRVELRGGKLVLLQQGGGLR